jgi:hypothetical protein
MERAARRLVYRSPLQRATFGALLALDAAVFASALSRSTSVLGAVLGSVIFGAVAVVLVRAFLSVLVVDGEDVVVRGPLRTTKLRMDEIERFSLGRYKILGSVCLIHTREKVVPVFAVEGITGQPRRRSSVQAAETVTALNRILGHGPG